MIISCRSVFGDSWIDSLDPVLQDKVARDSRKRRSYCGSSVGDLLRFVRNTAHHYHELAPDVRAALGPKEELGNFWVSQFSLLLPSVHRAMRKFCKDTNCARIEKFYHCQRFSIILD